MTDCKFEASEASILFQTQPHIVIGRVVSIIRCALAYSNTNHSQAANVEKEIANRHSKGFKSVVLLQRFKQNLHGTRRNFRNNLEKDG